MIDYEIVLKQFKKYLEKFDVKDEMIAMKISHSYHTADLAKKLGKRLKLTEEELILSETLGLLHDIGRFVQYEKTQAYNDITTNIDHAEVAIEYLFYEGHIKDFEIPEKYYRIIEKAIFNHNKLEIEEGLSEKELFFVKLLRDIDKIDIFRQEATSTQEWVYCPFLSEDVKKDFYKHHLINRKKVKNSSDKIVSEIAYVFDINFKESYELLNETDNLELFLSVIEVENGYEEEFESIKKEVRNYLEERISE